MQTATPVLQVQPPTDWHVLLLVLASQPSGVPAHEAAPDQVQLLDDRQVVLDELVEQEAAVPAQLPLVAFQVQPRSAAHMVLLTLLAQAVGAPLQARVALLQVHPDCAVQVVRLVLSLQAAGVPTQLGPADAAHVQPLCSVHEADVVCDVHGATTPEHRPEPVGQVQPGSAAQAVAVVFELQDLGVPEHVPAAGVLTRQPGTAGQVDVDRDAHDAWVGVPAQCGPIEKVTVAVGTRVRADLQQIWPAQSLLTSQVLGQDLLHMPLQHSSPEVVLQSADWVHALGQLAYPGFRHRPAAFTCSSTRRTVVQQISPETVSQSVDWLQDFGHFAGGRQ